MYLSKDTCALIIVTFLRRLQEVRMRKELEEEGAR